MQRVAHPTCISCGKIHPEFESKRFGIRVCYSCLLGAASGFHRKGIPLDSNPLITELFDGVFSGGVANTATHMPVVIRSDAGSSTFSFLSVEKYRESETNT
jgi:hypothetical protein